MGEKFRLWDGREVNLKEKNNKFKFKCQRGCVLCCMDHDIRLSPFDILRICERLKIKTDEFLRKYTLFVKDKQFNESVSCMLDLKNGCKFLEEWMCSVYEARPFLCRMYPLGTLFDDQKTIYYLHEKKCPGLDSGKKLVIEEYCIESLDEKEEEYYRKWIEFRFSFHGLNFPKEDKKYLVKFLNICYNFDSPLFKQYVNEFSLQNLNKIDAVFKVGKTVLLEPYEKSSVL